MERIGFMNMQAQRLSFGGDTWTGWKALRFSYWQKYKMKQSATLQVLTAPMKGSRMPKIVLFWSRIAFLTKTVNYCDSPLISRENNTMCQKCSASTEYAHFGSKEVFTW